MCYISFKKKKKLYKFEALYARLQEFIPADKKVFKIECLIITKKITVASIWGGNGYKEMCAS